MKTTAITSNLSYTFAEGCAWRAVYLYDAMQPRDKQVARLVLDATDERGPQLSGMVGSYSFRVTLPHIRWATCMRFKYAKPVMWLYGLQQSLRMNLDGRYGWGTEARRRRLAEQGARA